MKILHIILLFSLAFMPVKLAVAKNTNSIVAVVNNKVITEEDLNERFKFIRKQIRMDLTDQQIMELHSRTLGDLIDEELYRQYAQENNISVMAPEINMAIANIERTNKVEAGSFAKMAGDLIKTAREQVAGNILWQKIVEKAISKKVSIPNDEIDLLIENLLAKSQTTEREISHILITPKTQADEEKAKQKIYDIYKRLQNGESFTDLAQTFSTDSNSARNKGYLGWFSTGEMSPVLEGALENLNVDEYSKPVHSSAGWHILKLDSIRKTQKVSADLIEEINVWKINANISNSDKETIRLLKKAMKKVKQSEDITKIIKEFGDKVNLTGSGSIGWLKTDNLDLKIASALKNTKPRTVSKIIENDNKLELYLIKSKRERKSEQFVKYRERVRSRLTNNRIELLARKFLRNLRRKAYIDIRL